MGEVEGCKDPGRLPPLVAAGSPQDRPDFQNVGFRHFLLRCALSDGGADFALKFQKFHEPRHDFLAFVQPVFEAVDTFGGELAAGFG